MEEFRESLLIAVATPVYALVIGVEILFSHLNRKNLYSTKGVISNIYLMLLNMGLDIVMRGVCLFVLDYFFKFHVLIIETNWLYWIALLLLQDLMFYLLHVADHYCRLFWAVHVTHHSSEEFNLTVGFRSSVFQPLYRFIYFIPLALLGFKGIDIMFMYSATQIYGILVHTQTVGKLGFLEYFMVTPSHHRVHHGSNPLYLDRNMGMVFIIWDRLFGTFQEEVEPVRFGLTTKIETDHPVKMVTHEWEAIFSDIKKSNSVKDVLKYIFYRPGWSHDGSRYTSDDLRKITLGKNQASNFSS
ncbi:MAG: sterol desaturase family protein [Bacteroidia bacterium]|nr:sterol desaturase family protein [Bacteroidia bacterium]